MITCAVRDASSSPEPRVTWAAGSSLNSSGVGDTVRCVVREPRKVLAEFGTALPEGIAIRVHDSTADMRYMVLPMRPAGTDGWTEERLAALVTRDSLIGVGLAGAATDETIAS